MLELMHCKTQEVFQESSRRERERYINHSAKAWNICDFTHHVAPKHRLCYWAVESCLTSNTALKTGRRERCKKIRRNGETAKKVNSQNTCLVVISSFRKQKLGHRFSRNYYKILWPDKHFASYLSISSLHFLCLWRIPPLKKIVN